MNEIGHKYGLSNNIIKLEQSQESNGIEDNVDNSDNENGATISDYMCYHCDKVF